MIAQPRLGGDALTISDPIKADDTGEFGFIIQVGVGACCRTAFKIIVVEGEIFANLSVGATRKEIVQHFFSTSCHLLRSATDLVHVRGNGKGRLGLARQGLVECSGYVSYGMLNAK